MNNSVRDLITKTISQILKDSTSDAQIRQLKMKHEDKVHFIPIKYRIIGGVLQSLNIKFGNFIENLIGNIVEIDSGVEVMRDSGKKIRLYFTPATDSLVDTYITERQLPNSGDDCTVPFNKLLNDIIGIERSATDSQRQGIIKDIDSLFRTNNGLMVYAEIKYNDDHDTGKFADINRKFIKTWAGLAVRLNIKSPTELTPIIYYFNPTKRYGPIHTPSKNIMRGPQLFEAFLETKYSEVDQCMSDIGDDPDIMAIFDKMYDSIRHSKRGI